MVEALGIAAVMDAKVPIVDQGQILVISSLSRLIVEAALGSTVVLPNVMRQAANVGKVLRPDFLRVTSDGLEIKSQDTVSLFAIFAANDINTRHAQVYDGRLFPTNGKGLWGMSRFRIPSIDKCSFSV